MESTSQNTGSHEGERIARGAPLPPGWRILTALCGSAALGWMFPFVLVASQAQSGETQTREVVRLVDGVEARLERMRDLSAEFVQTVEDPLNQTEEASGHLYVKNPRRMRWEYANGQLFLSDGDTLYLYVPSDDLVHYEEVGESFDDRVPIMFLLGRSDLQQEFSRIVLDPTTAPHVAGTRVLRMVPRREGDVEEVLIEVEPETFDVMRLRLSYVDGASSDFVFSQIRSDTGLEDSLFEFEIPPGAEVIEGL